MIIEIKDFPNNAKSITIDKIVIEFCNGEITEITQSEIVKTEQVISSNAVSEELNTSKEIAYTQNVQEIPKIPQVQHTEEIQPIPEEMTDMEF